MVASAPPADLARLALPADALVGVIERVEKPGNLGAIVRSADGAGLDAVIVADPASDPWNPNAIRASLGTIFALPLAVASASEARGYLLERGIHLVAAVVDAPLRYTDAEKGSIVGCTDDGATVATTTGTVGDGSGAGVAVIGARVTGADGASVIVAAPPETSDMRTAPHATARTSPPAMPMAMEERGPIRGAYQRPAAGGRSDRTDLRTAPC